MPISDLLMDGLYLMLLGMGIVFAFLTLLVGAMRLMSRLAFGLAGEPVAEAPLEVSPANATPGVYDEEIVAVISAALQRYRSRRR